MSLSRKTVLLTIGIISASCTRYVSIPLPVPVMPELPQIRDRDLLCLSDDIYIRLARRDLILKSHIRQLETIIKAHK